MVDLYLKYIINFTVIVNSILCIFCDQRLSNKISFNKIDVKGKVLEVFNLNDGVQKSNITLSGGTELKLGDYYVSSGTIEKKTWNRDKNIYFINNPSIKGVDLELLADSFILNIKNGILEIKNDVYCKYKDVIFETNSCEFDLHTNTLSFYNDGLIEESGIIIKSRKGDLNLNTAGFSLSEGVVVETDDYILTCDLLRSDGSFIRCRGNVKIVDKKGKFTIYSDEDLIIYYESKNVRMNKVIIVANEHLLFAEDVTYLKNENKVSIINGVEILAKNKYHITSYKAEYDITKKSGYIEGNTLIETGLGDVYQRNNPDNIYISTNRIDFDFVEPKDELLEPDELDKFDIKAYKNAEFPVNDQGGANKLNVVNDKKIDYVNKNGKLKVTGTLLKGSSIKFETNDDVELYSNNLKVISKGLKYKNSKIELNNDVYIWQGNNQIVSSNAVVYFDDGIKKVILQDNPIIAIYKNGFPSQIKSKEVYLGFNEGKIDTILFNNNVDTVLYIFNSKNKISYVNRMTTERLCIIFDKNGDPLRALYNENRGKIIPVDGINSDLSSNLFLDGYHTLLGVDQPTFDDIASKIWKVSRIPMSYVERFLTKK